MIIIKLVSTTLNAIILLLLLLLFVVVSVVVVVVVYPIHKLMIYSYILAFYCNILSNVLLWSKISIMTLVHVLCIERRVFPLFT